MNPDHIQPIKTFLMSRLEEAAPADGLRWLKKRQQEIKEKSRDRTFYLTFSAIPRYLGKKPIPFTNKTLEQAGELREGFNPSTWTVDRAARIWLLFDLPHEDADTFVQKVEMLFDTADMGELVALYSSLPLLPYPEHFTKRAAEGVRTNMTVVFDAIALDNPYPADYLDQGAWNQMVLKAAFMDRPIHRIYGLQQRANPELAQIISDYAHERWAAGRVVSPEFWRPVGPFVDATILQDIRRLFQSDNPLQREAAALVCADSDSADALALLDQHPALKDKINQGAINWEQLAEDWWKEKGG
jgi:hypothetical protein